MLLVVLIVFAIPEQVGGVQEHIEYSLELACQEQFLGEAQRRAIAQAAVAALQARTPPSTPQASPRSSGEPISLVTTGDLCLLGVQSYRA